MIAYDRNGHLSKYRWFEPLVLIQQCDRITFAARQYRKYDGRLEFGENSFGFLPKWHVVFTRSRRESNEIFSIWIKINAINLRYFLLLSDGAVTLSVNETTMSVDSATSTRTLKRQSFAHRRASATSVHWNECDWNERAGERRWERIGWFLERHWKASSKSRWERVIDAELKMHLDFNSIKLFLVRLRQVKCQHRQRANQKSH